SRPARRPLGRREADLVGTGHRLLALAPAHARDPAGIVAGNPHRREGRNGDRRHRHHHLGDDRAAIRPRQLSLHGARYGPIRSDLCGDPHRRSARIRPRLGVRTHSAPIDIVGSRPPRRRYRGDLLMMMALAMISVLKRSYSILLLLAAWE